MLGAAACGTFEKHLVRSVIEIGNALTISTPDVISFNVSRRRGQMSATFSASIRVPHTFLDTAVDLVADNIVIRAGHSGVLNTVFTGWIYQCVVNPIRTDASKVMLNITGHDVLHILEGQHVNRRATTWRDGERPPERWGVVNNIIKEHSPLNKKFPTKLYTPENVFVPTLTHTHHVITPDPFATKKEVTRGGEYKVYGGIDAAVVPSLEGE